MQPQTAANDAEHTPAPDLDAAKWYLNRELTWLEFNRRVLSEGVDARNPALERLKFFSIFASNLDEFFMNRVGGLQLQARAGVGEPSVDGRGAQTQLDEIYATVRAIEAERDRRLPALLGELRRRGICIFDYLELPRDAREQVRRHYLENIFPLVTPQAIDPAHPFPFISNLSLNILVALKTGRARKVTMARVKVPVGADVPRFMRVENREQNARHYVPLEQVMLHNLDALFPRVEIVSADLFFVCRNAAAEREESRANDLLSMIELELHDRRVAPIVRAVVGGDMSDARKDLLAAEIGVRDIFRADGFLGQRDFMQLAAREDLAEHWPDLYYPPHTPANHRALQNHRSVFDALRAEESILLQHPYESFTASVVRFLEEAARDPDVRAIKMTLYRTDKQMRAVDLLIEAARNGKQVAVVVELKAKFDEAANIRWSERMEQAGIHVTWGVVGLKTHCKVLMAVRQEAHGLRRYVHLGTGNYHGGNARIYADLGLLTCNEDIGRDVTELFNYLTTGCAPQREYRKLIPAPGQLKKTLLQKIDREIHRHKAAGDGLIQMKVNALEDRDITRKLYAASMAGVKIELIVRDACRLRPGVAGLSDNITLISIVGRFLEHSRIFYFRNGGDEEYFIGSADLMRRNLERRIEVVVGVDSAAIKQLLRALLDAMLADERNAWRMQADGGYTRQRAHSDAHDSQQQQIDAAQTRAKQAARQ